MTTCKTVPNVSKLISWSREHGQQKHGNTGTEIGNKNEHQKTEVKISDSRDSSDSGDNSDSSDSRARGEITFYFLSGA